MALENIPTIGPGALNANLDKVVVYKNGGSEAAVSLLTLTNSALNLSGVYLDPINGRVGIGVPNPVYPLDVANAGRIGGIVLNDGGSDNRITASNPYLFLIAGGAILQMQGGGFSTGQYNTTAKFDIKGKGSTSATTSLLVQNSSAVDLLKLQDNGVLTLGTFASGLGKIVVTSDPAYGVKTVMENNFGGQIIRQVSTDVIWFGGQVQTGLFATGFITIGAPFINGNTVLGNTTASSFNFYVNGSPYGQTPSTASRGVLFNGGFGFQSGGYANYFELSPTYTFDISNNRIVKGIYYNPTLVTPNTNDKHYGIQTTSGGAYINTTTPQASACLQADSVTQGFLKPKMTTAQKNAIVTPAAGLEVYDTDLNRPCFYNGTSWITL